MPNTPETRARYEALRHAETGSFRNPWIRTTGRPPEGSTAFGPVQITKKLGSDPDYYNRLSQESQDFYADVLWPKQQLMARYGAKDMQPGYEEYDYGQEANFSPEDRVKYEKWAREMIALMSAKHSDVQGFAQGWRGKDATQDPDYFKRFNQAYTRDKAAARQRALYSTEDRSIGTESEALLR